MKFLLILGATLCSLQAVSSRSYKSKAIVEGAIGNRCEYDDDCITTNAYCKSNRQCNCKLNYQYVESEETCFPTKLGLKCTDDYECSSFANAQCRERVCVCRQGFVLQNDQACLPTSRLMATCQANDQCVAADQFSWCNTTSGLCACSPNYHEAYDTQKCVPNKRMRDECTNHASCANTNDQRDKVECRADNDGRNKCFCRSGFGEGQQNGVSVCLEGLGPDGATTAVVSTALIVTASLVAFLKTLEFI